MLELVDSLKTYELPHESGAVFILSHWTLGMQEEVDKRCFVVEEGGKFKYLLSLEREIKISLALKDWRGVAMNGIETSCTPETKKKLPIGVVLWLIKDIDERAGLRMTETEKKT